MSESISKGVTLHGRYQLESPLGQGGMGVVWAGVHLRTGRKVAIKFLDERFLSNTAVVERFGREARAASAIRHPGIVEVLDLDMTPDGVPFLVMERLVGETLTERIERSGKITEADATSIMIKLLDALDAAHAHGVIHRDLKPDNVFLIPGGQDGEVVKILDFGISHKADEKVAALTIAGSVLGTPHYMAPEQARGDLDIDNRADIYAAGIVFYECVTGDVPFDAANYNRLIQRILSDEPPPPEERGATLSAPIRALLLQTLSKNADDRPPSAQAILEVLRRSRPTLGGHSSAPPGLGDSANLGAGSGRGPILTASASPERAGSPVHLSSRPPAQPLKKAVEVVQVAPPDPAQSRKSVAQVPAKSADLAPLELGDLDLKLDKRGSEPAPRARPSLSPDVPELVDPHVKKAAEDFLRASTPSPQSRSAPPVDRLDLPEPPPAAALQVDTLDVFDQGPRIELDEMALVSTRRSSAPPQVSRRASFEPAPPPEPSRAWMGWAAGALVLCVGLVVGIRLLVRPDEVQVQEPVVQAPSEQPDLVTVRIVELPDRAVLRLDGLPATPPLQMRRGTALHRLEIHAPGHESRTLQFEASRNQELSGRLDPILRRPIQ